MMMRSIARTLLSDRTYDIEFHGYLTNHAPNERVQGYWDQYTTSTPYHLPLHKVETDWNLVTPATRAEWEAWRGTKQNFQAQVAYLQHELTSTHGGDVHKLVAAQAPDLLGGMMGALTHTIIHLGWAIDADSEWMTLEGLAYLNFAHVGVADAKLVWNAVNDKDPMASLERVAITWEKDNLGETWIDTAKAARDKSFHPELVPASFQWELAKVADQPHPVVTQLPSWISSMPLPQVFESLYRTTVYLYLATRDAKDGHGNFLVLHLVTSLWGLEKTLEVINNEQTSRRALGHYYASLICLLATASSGFPSQTAMTAIQAAYPDTAVDAATYDWTEAVQAGIAEEEEHNIKLVYVMKELWNRYNYWKGFSEAAKSFTLTPNIGPAQTSFTQ